MQDRILKALIFIVVAVGFLVYSTFFIVKETHQAIVLQLGEPKKVYKDAGLYWKIPLLQNVQLIDKRVLEIDAPAEEVIALDQKRIIVDAYAKFIITDPLKFYISVGNERVAQSRLSSIINAKIRGVLGKENLVNLISNERTKLMNKITKDVAEEAKDFGINVIDVRIRRADLPSANSEAIFKRMQTERTREAKEFRAEGFELGQTIKSTADKEVSIILAEARKTSQILRGEGDGLRNKIFAEAFGRDPEFFSFYRAMQSYEKSLINGSETSLVLSPDSEFFRYFGESGLNKILKR
ncbi:HflC Membrane protease subunits, stomatin/prohibitin homologs [Candidatus Pelagibacterales bacterium]|jgi:modulator of FtsH protease HflC